MVAALVAHVGQGSSNGNGFTTSGINTTGATLLVCTVTDDAGTSVISDSTGNTWATVLGPSATQPFHRVLYVRNPSTSPSQTFTVTTTGGAPSLQILAFSGTDTTANVDQSSSAEGGHVATLQPGSITPSADGEVVVSAFGYSDTNAGATVDSGFTITDQNLTIGGATWGGGAAYLVQTVAAAINPTWSNSNSQLTDASIASFKAAVAGGGGSPQKARPSTDITDGNWLNESGSNTDLYASIDEATASDTDYIQSATNPQADLVEVALGPVSDPLVSTGHVLRYRTRLNTLVTNSGAMSLVTELRQGASALSTPVSDTITLSSATETTNSVTLSSAQADAITDYRSLRLRSTATQGDPTMPSFIAAGTLAATATNAATFAPTIPDGAVGDLLLLIIQRNDTTAAPTVTGCTNIPDLTGTNSTTQSVAVYFKYATSATGATDQQAITFGSSTIVRGGVWLRFRSTHGSAPEHLATRVNVASTATTVNATNLTSTINSTLGVFIACNIGARSTTNTTTNWTAGAGVTAFASQQTTLGNDLTIGYGIKTFPTAGSYLTPGIVWTTNTTTGVGQGLLLALAPVTNASKARITWAELEVPSIVTSLVPLRRPYRFFRRAG